MYELLHELRLRTRPAEEESLQVFRRELAELFELGGGLHTLYAHLEVQFVDHPAEQGEDLKPEFVRRGLRGEGAVDLHDVRLQIGEVMEV